MDLLIHVGLHKTGTTSVQNHLCRRRECLLQEGILYPLSGLYGSQHALIPGSVIPKHFFLDRVPRSLCTSDYLDELSKEVKDASPRLVILSSEIFSEIAPNRAACLGIINELQKEYASCSLLLSTRNVQELALSALKHSAREGIEASIEDPLGYYTGAFRWTSFIQNFWETSGFPIHLRSIDSDASGNLTDHYFGEIISNYCKAGRRCLAVERSRQEDDSDQKLNFDGLHASIYAILFLIGNTSKSHLLARQPIISIILRLDEFKVEHPKALDSISTKHLLGFLEHYRLSASICSENGLRSVSTVDKLNVFGIVGVADAAIEVMASIAAKILSLI